MALSKLDQLYRQVILDPHSSHPHHKGLVDDATFQRLNLIIQRVEMWYSCSLL